MPYLKVWLHIVWSTKLRRPLLTDDIRQELFMHIKENALLKGIYVDHVNGYVDHVHCLVGLGADQTIAKTVQLLKGESAFWANRQQLAKEKLEWQTNYFAVSVSESGIGPVRRYIRNQEAHHRRRTWAEEEQGFVEKYGFVLLED
jgi:putative transposase